MALDDLSKLLTKDKKNIAIKEAELSYVLAKIIQKNWDNIFGKLGNQVNFSHIYNGILVVETSNPLWVTELSFYKKDLLKKINGFTKKNKVYDIRIKLATLQKNDSKIEYIPEKKPETLEEKIIEENKRKKAMGYWQCEGCLVWWEKGDPCVFCKL